MKIDLSIECFARLFLLLLAIAFTIPVPIFLMVRDIGLPLLVSSWLMSLAAISIASWISAYVSVNSESISFRTGCHTGTEYTGGDTFESHYQLSYQLGPCRIRAIPKTTGSESILCPRCGEEIKVVIRTRIRVFFEFLFQGILPLASIVFVCLMADGRLPEDLVAMWWEAPELVRLAGFGGFLFANLALFYDFRPIWPFLGCNATTFVTTETGSHAVFAD